MDDTTIKAFRSVLERMGMEHISIDDLLRAFESIDAGGQSTDELADSLHIKSQSIHARLSRFGSYYGLRPKKLPNGRLLWPRNGKDLLKRPPRLR